MRSTIMSPLSTEESARYQRQIVMKEIGEGGQERLKNAHVLIAGVGGLGSILAYYMAAAGVGTLTIVDKDRVETGNLNRQIIHRTEDIGKPKVFSAREKLLGLNPLCRVEAIQLEVNSENAYDLTQGCDLILDGTDNLQTRRVLNRASVRRGTPLIYGGVDGMNGMVSTFVPGQTPCLECLFPEGVSPPERAPAVIGPLPGVVASIQSLEAIKVLLGIGDPLKGRLLYIRGFDISFKEIELRRNPHCRIC